MKESRMRKLPYLIPLILFLFLSTEAVIRIVDAQQKNTAQKKDHISIKDHQNRPFQFSFPTQPTSFDTTLKHVAIVGSEYMLHSSVNKISISGLVELFSDDKNLEVHEYAVPTLTIDYLQEVERELHLQYDMVFIELSNEFITNFSPQHAGIGFRSFTIEFIKSFTVQKNNIPIPCTALSVFPPRTRFVVNSQNTLDCEDPRIVRVLEINKPARSGLVDPILNLKGRKNIARAISEEIDA